MDILSPVCSLDGRYWNAVFKDNDYISKEPIVISLHKNGEVLFPNKFLETDKNYIFRMRIYLDEEHIHSNLVFISMISKKIYRYEPLQEDYFGSNLVDSSLYSYISHFIGGFGYEVYKGTQSLEHSIFCPRGGLCVAYCIREVMKNIDMEVEDDINQFTQYIISEYSHKLDIFEEEQIEFGPSDRQVLGIGLGVLGGVAIGGIVGGPGGAIVGGLAGGTIGYLATR